ncbi:MAG: 16S rRNA (adenine(1518)-N(6)/adenine(1519)-N(6))-dimethyltransferase RsmA [Ignavibacteria bacterium]|nr:16S rRNA (adenine(1518)-N(6)/adenine(1519)-N(6))-dimethyltransferase RsmA [Ignavibacteria bacterium]
MKNASFTSKKSLGQNFLIDNNIAKKIVGFLELKENDLVVEIGPGKGKLTEFLIRLPIFYIGVEIDKMLCHELEGLFSDSQRYKIINQDFLEFNEEYFSNIFGKKIILVGNIPYYLTSPILFKFLDNRFSYEKAVLMVQREVGERIVAKPKTKEYGTLSVLLQYFTKPRKLISVPPQCFSPVPKVYSTVVSLEVLQDRIEYPNYSILKQVVRKAFNQRRKMLLNSLFKRLGIGELLSELDPVLKSFFMKRAEELSPNDFEVLVNILVNNYYEYVQNIN